MKIEFKGNFLTKFKKPNLVKMACTKIAYGVLNQAKELTPVVTGNLRRSEQFQNDNDKILWGSHVDYAQKIEDREHYLKDGVKLQRQNIMRELKDAFEGNLK